jgi:ABC-2 family transporter protein
VKPTESLANVAPTPRAVAIVLLPALVLMLAFAFFYVGAFHDPTPHRVPLAVVGPPAVAAQLNRLPGDPLDARQASSRSDALSQINDREVYGAYEVAPNRLFVASAANRATAVALEQTFNRVAAAQHRPAVRLTDVKPLPPKDPNGTAAFYAVIAWVFGGYIGATLIGLIGSPRSSSTRRAAARIGAFAGFGIVAGILSVVMLRASFGVFSGHVVALCAIAALTIFASGAATAGIQAAAGPAGTGLVILAFVILGNSASGGPFARPLLPGLWRTIGGILPPGAGVDLARSALFFDGARIAGPILVLVGWAALGTSLALALGGRIMDPVDVEASAAAGASV